MNYLKVYSEFIKDRREKENIVSLGYFEKHHIKPKSLGGDNSSDNLIKISASDHLFAHKLLALIYGGKMWHALHMCNINDSAAKSIRLSRRWYEKVRIERSKHITATRSGENHHFYGKKFSPEHIRNLSESHKGGRMGEKNNKYDPVEYNFRNVDGRHEKKTKRFMVNNHGIPSSKVSDICNGKRPSSFGWYVSDTVKTQEEISKKGCFNKSINTQKIKFKHDSGLSEYCTQYALYSKYKGLNQSHVSAVVRGKRKKHMGWQIEK